MLVRASLLGLVAACSSPAPAPATTVPIAEPPSPFAARRCDLMADALRDRCTYDRAAFFTQCNQLQRLGEASACIAQTQRSFDCSLEVTARCTSSDDCCTKAISACDDLDTALTHCLRGYCGARGADPDCEARFAD